MGDGTQNYYGQLDDLFSSLARVMSNFNKSLILQEFIFQIFSNYAYANLISNFFRNLDNNVLSKLNLDLIKVPMIKNQFANIQQEIASSLELTAKKKIDLPYYNNFKKDLAEKFPDYMCILLEIERQPMFEHLESYLHRKKIELEKFGKATTDYKSVFTTRLIERLIQRNAIITLQDLASLNVIHKSDIIKDVQNEISQKVFQEEKKRLADKIPENEKVRWEFENRLYKRWQEPLDLFESMILLSIELGEKQKKRLSKDKEFITNSKHVALLKIHARSILIAREILVLLKAGYVDGAHARWRSLYEIDVISFFLKDHVEIVSERYLNHHYIRRSVEASVYQGYSKRLGQQEFTKEEIDALETERKNLVEKYGSDYTYSGGYGWIPSTILKKRDFRELERTTKIDHLRPYYNWSSNQVHGGSHAFDYLGVPVEDRDKILFIGPSNHGLTDPLHTSALSLIHTTMNFLTLENYPEFPLDLSLLLAFADEIGRKSLEITEEFEKSSDT